MADKMWKKILIITAVAVVLFGVIFSGQISKKYQSVKSQYAHAFHEAINNKLYDGFKKTADQFNKRGPIMVSKNLRLDKTEAGPGARIAYFYTFTNNTSHDFKPAELKTTLGTKLAELLCKNDKVKPTLNLGADYIYVYSGNDGLEIMRIDINKDKCSTE